MNRRLALWTSLGALTLGMRVASAQEVTVGYQGLPYKASGETNTGIQLSEGLLLHSGIGVEAGYDTNVFYAPNNVVGSTIVRVMPYLELTNATRTGPVSRDVTFDVRAGLLYRYYGSDNADVKKYRSAWMPNAGASLGFTGAQVGIGFADVFSRIEDPPYVSQVNVTGPLTRDNNQASVELRYSPGGGRLVGLLRYTNMIDVFDNPYNYANSVSNTLTLDLSWKWLPKTAVFIDVQQGYVFYLNNNTVVNPMTGMTEAEKVSSFPLHVTVGLRGLLTAKTSAVLSIGYANGFYSSGGSTNGFLGTTYADLALTIQLTQLSRAVLGFRHDFLNSVISNFAYEETAYVSYVQQIAGRLGLDLSGRYAYLSYEGNVVDPTQNGRVDNFFQVGASLDYFLRNWAYVGVGYSLLDNRSNIASDDYLKQQVFARLGITY
jgi:hypothetical protein